MIKYLVADTETSGLNFKENALLTAYFGLLDENFNIVDELDLKILPYAPYNVITEEAMKINGINLDDHNKIAITHIEAGKALKEFLTKNKQGNSKVTPLLQNGGFDFNFIFEHLVSDKDWQKFCTRGYLDTKRFMDILVDLGMFPSDMTSLEKSVKYLEIPAQEHHNARADSLMTVEVYKKLKQMLKNSMNSAGNFSEDLLESIE